MGNKPFWYHPKTGRIFENKLDIPDSLSKEVKHWDSILEFDIYQKMLKVIAPENITHQYLIELLPKQQPFPKWTWNCDFRIQFDETKQVLVEAKGKWILKDDLYCKNFAQTLRLLQVMHPEVFKSLLIVDAEQWVIPGTQIMVIKADDLPAKLLTMKSY